MNERKEFLEALKNIGFADENNATWENIKEYVANKLNREGECNGLNYLNYKISKQSIFSKLIFVCKPQFIFPISSIINSPSFVIL